MLSRPFISALWLPAGNETELLALDCDFELCFCHNPMWYPGTGVVLNCINSLSATFLTFMISFKMVVNDQIHRVVFGLYG